ncbi:uncharacterized protein AMSG_07747 [Thecamonas trahens ATCC 50062]|uniref:Uncharacterized protein n=1 Tax=Thecamonas trahens ATCC 50062 TaxID=461836 RepID=A0A0L0DK20_THETB|nr:hypothetical protein AMSG_07747 [Thecamonas trahens ATCC 50062]KNC51683.1 hypothetical protein AMSG_07747 [Thecamonas trahens ATCC 50062]|eukprot:XP_013755814.1 hypothetical protein AMSG_07747 [Thecamonas trahens ATCC 50062]
MSESICQRCRDEPREYLPGAAPPKPAVCEGDGCMAGVTINQGAMQTSPFCTDCCAVQGRCINFESMLKAGSK